jgi:hypothetical protein
MRSCFAYDGNYLLIHRFHLGEPMCLVGHGLVVEYFWRGLLIGMEPCRDARAGMTRGTGVA